MIASMNVAVHEAKMGKSQREPLLRTNFPQKDVQYL